ncbi:glycosyltransferase [Subtercola sp. RTI3]|uniref:glycosyltransferase n=1 Tax=Subtercola sp. RTI3 TaxID=3048639 RepID=UPI002B23B0EE|nr:glycosyltransferase [Subtercola sp. RTI3]MEA9984422.1 glycosyltransferase [Subtercola sp. RTI3]
MSTSIESPSTAHLTQTQLDNWLAGLSGISVTTGPSAEELQASLSWRVTRPMRAVRARERLSGLRQGRLTLPVHHADLSALFESRTALHQRLTEVAPHLLPDVPVSEFGAMSTDALLGAIAARVHERNQSSELWMLIIAVSGCFPDQAMLQGLQRDITGVAAHDAIHRLLNHCAVWTTRHHSQLRTLKVVSDRRVAFADQTAKFGFNSGIQRVTRQILSHWDEKAYELVALTTDGTALRTVTNAERQRVVQWSNEHARDDLVKDQKVNRKVEFEDTTSVLVVPWKTTFFTPEVPVGRGTDTLTALARYSPNRTIALGYDTIPVSSGHLVPRHLSGLFVSYLSMLKYFTEVIAISEAVNGEFTGFAEAAATQGLPPFTVSTLVLPLERIEAGDSLEPVEAPPLPLVVSVGSNEPRKNQLSVIFASEVLWRQGLQFSLLLLGGSGDREMTAVPDAVAALSSQGRSIEQRRDVDEVELAAAYRQARFTVFISVQEGYGLPVAESLAVGTPVLATGYGSTAEIAAGGGCLTVDPRDDDDIVAGMRQLLTDDALLDRLHSEITARVDSTWADYSRSLWQLTATNQDSE